MILYFETSNGERKEIGHPESEKEIFKLISDFLKKHNYKSCYTRIWKNEIGEICYDVGSHSEFFVLVDDELYNELKNVLNEIKQLDEMK